MGGSWGARPPYCSGAPPCAAPKLGPRVAPARWCGLACRPRPPWEQAAGGARARGVQVQPHPPPPASWSLLGDGGRPLGSRGAEGRSCGSQAGEGERGGGGAGWPPPHPPAPSGVGLPSVVSGVPPQGILVPRWLPGGRGRQARSGRPPTGQCGGWGVGEGGGSRAEGAVWGTSLRRCSGPVPTRGRGWARCPPVAQVPRARFPCRAPVLLPGRSPCPRPLVGGLLRRL